MQEEEDFVEEIEAERTEAVYTHGEDDRRRTHHCIYRRWMMEPEEEVGLK